MNFNIAKKDGIVNGGVPKEVILGLFALLTGMAIEQYR